MTRTYVGAKELAEVLGVSAQTVDRLTRQKLIPFIEIPGLERKMKRYNIEAVAQHLMFSPDPDSEGE